MSLQQQGSGSSTEKKLDANGNDVTINLYTLLTDNLGSVVAITDEQANVTQRFYYTPFGEQRQIDGKTLDAPLTHKGFTGHEEVECVNLIHMSGRMYDPRIGRFLSADPFVQDYENPQTLNRYSYCLNNPITFTDPSGYWSLSDFFDSICDIFKNLFSANGLLSLIGVAALAFLNPLLAAAVMAISNGVATAASGGDMGSVLFAMGSSFATSLIWMGTGSALEGMKCGVGVAADKWMERALVHGIVGGGIQAAEGGSFKDGFLGAAVSEAISCKFSSVDANGKANFNIVERVSASYIIGGTAAAAAGGNFQNGAVYAELFNDCVKHAMELSKEGLQFIAGEETFRSSSYKDQAGHETIGYGHKIQSGEKFGTLNKEQALDLLHTDVSVAEQAVNRNVKISLKQNQFDALTSLTYNIGGSALATSNVLKNVNVGNFDAAANSFSLFNKVSTSQGLVVSAGLTARRERESNLFRYGEY